MTKNIPKVISSSAIESKILNIRNKRVILDKDLAKFYQVETRALKQAIRRNRNRFPEDFMFQLSSKEIDHMVSQFVIPSKSFLGGSKPLVFTESGVSMLASVIKTPVSIQVSIQIIRAFVFMRHLVVENDILLRRLNQVEQKQFVSDKKIDKLLRALKTNKIKFKQGIFYKDKVFDAHLLLAKLIQSSKKSILLIDNYINEETLLLFSDRGRNIPCTIYTSNITEKLRLSLKKFNDQYPPIVLKKFIDSHDRFLIIDNKDIYHIGASLKDLGKKWLAISKLNIDVGTMLEKLE